MRSACALLLVSALFAIPAHGNSLMVGDDSAPSIPWPESPLDADCNSNQGAVVNSQLGITGTFGPLGGCLPGNPGQPGNLIGFAFPVSSCQDGFVKTTKVQFNQAEAGDLWRLYLWRDSGGLPLDACGLECGVANNPLTISVNGPTVQSYDWITSQCPCLVFQGERIVLSFYHRRLVLMPQAYPFRRRSSTGERRGVAILSSDSKDGERSAATWRWFGIHAVRGTAGDRGAQALVRMIQAVRQDWDLGITVDGPRGPRQEVKPGVLAVSRKTGAWIVPVCVGYARAWTLRTWDAMLVPKPFTDVVVRYGTPFQVPAEGPEAPFRDVLQADLDGLETWAEELARG